MPEHWLIRGVKTVLVRRTMPYRVQVPWDRLMRRVGRIEKTVRLDGYAIRIRRLTSDQAFVETMLVQHDYTRNGFQIRPTDTVIDIGANIGTFALDAARCASQGRVLCFEPDADNFRLLQMNLRRNHCHSVTAVRAAVAGADGDVTLFCATEGGYHSIRSERGQHVARTEIVPGVSLERIFERHQVARCNFLKLDCEGAEYEILYALPPPYFRRIERIAMEYHGGADPVERRAQADALAAHLERQGFRIDDYVAFPGFRCGFLRASNLDFQSA